MTPLATALLAERTLRRWNQRTAAQELGVSQAQYQKWESGENEPGGRYYPRIFEFLRLTEPQAAELILQDRLARARVSLQEAEEWKSRGPRGNG